MYTTDRLAHLGHHHRHHPVQRVLLHLRLRGVLRLVGLQKEGGTFLSLVSLALSLSPLPLRSP